VLWLAHRHGSVTILPLVLSTIDELWLAHRHGSVTIPRVQARVGQEVVSSLG
jgi:hypothetical protein